MQLFSKENIRPEGWIYEFLLRDKNGITGNLGKLCKDADSGIFAENKVAHTYSGIWSSWWPSEIEGNWREAYILLAYLLNDDEMIRDNEQYISKILDEQDIDGYIGIYKSGERFGDGERNGELWAQSRIMRCLLAYYHFTGDAKVLDALVKAIDLTISSYGPSADNRSFFKIPDEDGSKTHGLMIIETILAVHDYVERPGYVEFCEFLYDDFSEHVINAKFPCYDLSSQMAVDPHIPFVGHGPHTCEHLRIPLLLYKATGKKIYHSVFVAAYEKLLKNMTLSGSCKSDEMIGAYLGNISDSKNDFNVGKSYPLPCTGYEYCSTTELLISLITALNCTDDPSYADRAEWLVMNASMAAKRQDGKAILYLCADNLYEASRNIGTRWDYSPTHQDTAVCCAPNSCKVMPLHLTNMWRKKDDNNILAHFYGPNTYHVEIKGVQVSIAQKTKYPFEDTINMAITADAPFETGILFRIPGWISSISFKLNGSPVAYETVCSGKGKYACIRREFHNNDQIMITMDQKPRLIKAVDNTVAVAMGPLLYSLDISAERNDYFKYEAGDFFDTDYVPRKEAKWDYALFIDQDRTEDCMMVKRNDDPVYGWDLPPVAIRVKMLSSWSVPELIDLIPIGCTNLRRTTFPYVSDIS